ncbi:Elongator subunit Iki1-domain-containing protein [Phaeosphaeria sp. MPI-PUGE-AT-0046c]|nr:Elongator subunit Iki1-domain-containing protein [Phaeosphaeria sp. MPI-PUGE-AT-0046c]
MLSNADFAFIHWGVVLETPYLVEHFVDKGARPLPEWHPELYGARSSATICENNILKKKSKVRSAACTNWIKKENFPSHRIRKRQPRIEDRPLRTMAPISVAQYQRHSIQLISRVLNIRTNASPFTLVLDDLNQRAMPLISELVRRALSRNVNVVVISFESIQFHPAVQSIAAHGVSNGAQLLQQLKLAMDDAKESLVIVDSLYELLAVDDMDITALFNLVAGKYASTLVGVYHQDMLSVQNVQNPYAPQPLDLVKYMATCVMTCKSFAHVLAAKAAKERSLAEPTHGLLQGAEGVVQCLDANDPRGIVLEAEFRRKSGRPEIETYFLRTALASDYNHPIAGMPFGTLKQEFVTLLDQVPAYGNPEVIGMINASGDEMESTFNLSLTDKQKQAREGVVLPYFDAQKGEGGEGGRILYDMGEEDDFDEEEDEI